MQLCVPRAYNYWLLRWHTGAWPDHVIEIKHTRLIEVPGGPLSTKKKPRSQLYVATVPISKSGVKSGKYVIDPFGMSGSGGHCAVKENNHYYGIIAHKRMGNTSRQHTTRGFWGRQQGIITQTYKATPISQPYTVNMNRWERVEIARTLVFFAGLIKETTTTMPPPSLFTI